MARLLLIGTACNVIFTQSGWPALINWAFFLTVSWLNVKSHALGPIPPLTLKWWAQVCYWLLLFSTLFVILALIHVGFFNLGLVIPAHPYRVNLAIILATMAGVMTGGLLELGLPAKV